MNNIQVRKTSTGQTINYNGVGQVTLNASALNDVINVKSTPAGMSLTVNANAGNDNLFFGNGNVDANLLGPVTLNAGSGPDFMIIDNQLDTSAESMTLNATSLVDGLTHNFTGVESGLTLNLGTGGTNLTINGTTAQTIITSTAASATIPSPWAAATSMAISPLQLAWECSSTPRAATTRSVSTT